MEIPPHPATAMARRLAKPPHSSPPDGGEGPCAPPIARGIQNRPPNFPAVQAGSTRPGFMMPLGSSAGEYVRGKYTNGVECFRAVLKRAHKGVCHKFGVKHLQRNVTDFASRHNVLDCDTHP